MSGLPGPIAYRFPAVGRLTPRVDSGRQPEASNRQANNHSRDGRLLIHGWPSIRYFAIVALSLIVPADKKFDFDAMDLRLHQRLIDRFDANQYSWAGEGRRACQGDSETEVATTAAAMTKPNQSSNRMTR